MDQESKAGLSVKCFGRFEVYRDGMLLSANDWKRRKTKTLLKVLLSDRGRVFTHDQLIEYLFPDLDPQKAIKNLLGRVGELRRALEPDLARATDSQYIINAGQGGYLFSPDAPIWLDIEEFEEQLKAAQAAERAGRWPEARESYQKAVYLYRGDHLSEDLYEEWTLAPREHWQELYLTALARLAECHARLGQYAQAIEGCRRLLELKPTNESVYRQKMLYHALAGEQSEALQTYQTCVKVLQEQLEVQPAPETRELYGQLLQGKIPSAESYPPPLTPARHNLPSPVTSFIGRQREIAEVKRLLPTTRLLTLTGIGGCGKTRLALQIARDLLDEYPGGIWLVDLAPLSDAKLIPQTMASVFGLREEIGRSLIATLIDYLRPRSLLLILDNCEHLLSGSIQLVDALLRQCPNLRILATSRESFDILGELVYPVPSISLPIHGPLPASLKQLMRYDAMHLFIERATFNRHEFTLTKEKAPTVTQICHRLDGIALAIELAASQLKTLSLEEIAQRLGDCFRLLTAGNRAALPRQQTLRATLDWSFNLLSEAERALLRRVSVFAGRWTLEAAEPVCAGESLEASGILDLLTHLVDKSLVVVEATGDERRYRLLETVRQYAHERMREAGELERVQDQHLQFFIGLLEKAQEARYGANQAFWFDRFAKEHDNLRLALSWSIRGGRRESALQLASALWWFWYVRGYLREGLEWLKRMLITSKGMRTEPHAKVLNGAGNLARALSDYTAARAFHEEALSIYRALESKRGIAATLSNLGIVTASQDDHLIARSLFEEALSLFRELGNREGTAAVLSNLANVAADQGDYAQAREWIEESLAIRRELAEKGNIALSLIHLGGILRCQGDYRRARALFEESLALAREVEDKHCIAHAIRDLGSMDLLERNYDLARSRFEESLSIYRGLGDRFFEAYGLMDLAAVLQEEGDYQQATALVKQSLALFRQASVKGGIGTALRHLASLAQCQKDYQRAAALYQESLTLHRALGEKPGIIGDLEGLARVACSQGDYCRSARLYRATNVLREAIGLPRPANEQTDYEFDQATVRAGLGETSAQALVEGQTLTLEQTIDYALEE